VGGGEGGVFKSKERIPVDRLSKEWMGEKTRQEWGGGTENGTFFSETWGFAGKNKRAWGPKGVETL